MHSFSWDSLWALFDGDHDHMNLAHKCVDRHETRASAISVKFADGHSEHYDYAVLADLSSRFANWLTPMASHKGDRVGIGARSRSGGFYVSLVWDHQARRHRRALVHALWPRGARDPHQRLPTTPHPHPAACRRRSARQSLGTVVDVNDASWAALQAASPAYTPDTRAADLAVLQYTSGTTRELPEAVKHTHRSVVTLMIAALYGVGLRPGDRYFCPSSPAWGHGLWHGTIAPLALGIHICELFPASSRPGRIFEALAGVPDHQHGRSTNSVPPAQKLRAARPLSHASQENSYTGEPMDPDTVYLTYRGVWGNPVQ